MDFTIVFMLIIGLLILNSINLLNNNIKHMNSTLNKIAKHMGVEDITKIDNVLRSLKSEGSNIEAVKKAREAFGMSLKEAKEYVDNL